MQKIDLVPPGTEVGQLQMAYNPPAVTNPTLRRRPIDERAAAERMQRRRVDDTFETDVCHPLVSSCSGDSVRGSVRTLRFLAAFVIR
jgi:hypothetical protein